MRPLARLCLILCLALASCRASSEAPASPPPTDRPAATDLEAASAVASAFLDAWARGALDAMYALITFRNQELTPFDTFQARYQDAHEKLSLERLDYTLHSLTGDRQVLTAQYALTFNTRNLGVFSDDKRLLRLVIDPTAAGWRVAWSPADIFAEMGAGAFLLYETKMPSRANIYDRGGNALADQNGRMVRILVDNGRIPEREACYRLLAASLGRTRQALADLFEVYSGADWIVDAGIIEPAAYIESGDRIQAVCGAEFRQQPTRRYAQGALMPHVLGHVGYPDAEQIPALQSQGFRADAIIGKAGIEASMNSTLAGKPGGRLSLISASGERLRLLSEVRPRIPESIWLTIDAELQAATVDLLARAYAEEELAEHSKGAAVAIMQVHNGEMLALASYPGYDGNIFTPFPAGGREAARTGLEALAADERLPQLNRVTQGLYPTGSVMKGLSAIAALDSGLYDESTRYNCVGSWRRGGDLRYDWLYGGHGIMSAQTSLTNSCNPFYYEVGYRLNALDPWLLPSYAFKLGFAQPTGIKVIAEAAGIIPTPANVELFSGLPWSYSHAVNLAIGQGELQVTPLQMLRLYAAIANGGYLLRPQLVRERGLLNQRSQLAERDVMQDTGLQRQHLDIIRRGLCDVVSGANGTASHVFYQSPLREIGVCGKTGTAQVPGDDKQPHSWFIAYAPAKEPQIAIVVMVENAGEGSSVAAPLARDILEFYYFGAR